MSEFQWYVALPRRVRMVRFNGNWDDLPAEARLSHNVELTEFGKVLIHTLKGPAELANGDYLVVGTADEEYPVPPAIAEYKYRRIVETPGSPSMAEVDDDPGDDLADAEFEQATQATREAIARAISKRERRSGLTSSEEIQP